MRVLLVEDDGGALDYGRSATLCGFVAGIQISDPQVRLTTPAPKTGA
jgi:hypothetical protein